MDTSLERLNIRALFDSAIVKLTLTYTVILLFVSIVFSISFYQVSVRELDANQDAQLRSLERRPGLLTREGLEEFLEEQNEELRDSKDRVFGRLLLGNIIVLGGSILLSYFLARKSLEPIKEAHEAQARFTADASHELRTPLTAMQTEIEVALRDTKLTKKEAAELLQSNLDELKKLTGLSDALLRLARRDDALELDKHEVDIKTLTSDAVKRTESIFKANKVSLKQKVQDGKVLVDPDMITEVMVILLDNAAKYSTPKDEVRFNVTRTNRRLQIVVSDTGNGIKATELPHIFDRFYRADSSRNKDGYGLGLSLAKQIIDLHYGTITVSSTVGKGTEFTVSLPA